MAEHAVDERGYPILLATDVPTASGNPAHQAPGSGQGGQFAPRADKQKGKDDQQAQAQQAGKQETARRWDVVRDAAREFENFTLQDVREFLRGRTNRPLSDAEVQGFLQDVRRQQIDDLVDVLDSAERGRLRGRRHVRVLAPKGYTKKTLHGLEVDELQEVARRLRAKGWDDGQIESLGKRLPEARRSELIGLDEPRPETPSPAKVQW